MTTERVGPSPVADEREMLRAYLDYHRATLAMKCDDLSDEDLRRQSMPPSTLSLLGLVRHMAEVERAWFRRVINGEDIPLVWSDEGDYQVAYDASTATRSEAFDAWQTEGGQQRRGAERDAFGHRCEGGEHGQRFDACAEQGVVGPDRVVTEPLGVDAEVGKPPGVVPLALVGGEQDPSRVFMCSPAGERFRCPPGTSPCRASRTRSPTWRCPRRRPPRFPPREKASTRR
ncbi:hypothetical protein FHR32_002715 [Streptosporangium album]|uniref:DUF664 domain-containing protein n=1 Tax=Streptosporangium album TaxID=47479 RepID=A0A7W7RUG0_9ACTN|nr:hypothetical protein [Streptosporangium album]